MKTTTVLQAAQSLLQVCDGAYKLDGVGFNKLDSFFVRDILRNGENISIKQEAALYRTLRKYRKQLQSHQIDYDQMEPPQRTTKDFSQMEPLWKVIPVPAKVTLCRRSGLEGKTGSKSFENLTEVEKKALFRVQEPLKEPETIKLDFFTEKFSNFYLYSPFSFSKEAKSIPTAYWCPNRPEGKAWSYQNKLEVAVALNPYIEKGIIHPTNRAREALQKLQKESLQAQEDILRRTQVSNIKNGETDNLSLLPVKNIVPFDHQRKAFAIATTLNKAALLMEQRTGKTLVAIAAAGYRFKQKQVKRLLVVCPLTVSSVWGMEFTKADFPYKLVDLTNLKDSERRVLLDQQLSGSSGLEVAIINYEGFWRCQELFNSWIPDMVIVDESQKIKNGQAKQSKALHKLGDKVLYKLILTGTPITQGPLDWWSQYRFLDPTIFGKSFFKFRREYATMGGYGGYKVVSYQNLDGLIHKAHSIAYRVTLDEVHDMPDPVTQTLKVDFSPDGRKLYNKMEKDFLVEFGDNQQATAPIILTQLMRLQQITSGFLPDSTGGIHSLEAPKLQVLKELLEDLPHNRKVVVFSRFLSEILAVEGLVKEAGRESVSLTGSTENRKEIMDRFRTDDDLTVFIAQIQAGGLGVDLSSANVVVFLSPNFSYADFSQARARVLGPKQTRPVSYILIQVQGTIDEDLTTALAEKQDMAKFLVDQIRIRGIGPSTLFTSSSRSDIINSKLNKEDTQMTKVKKAQVVTQEDELEQKLSDLKEEAEAGEEETIQEKPEVKKTTRTKKAAPEAKVSKVSDKETTETKGGDSNQVFLKDLAAEAGKDPRDCRKILRSKFSRAEGSSWSWDKKSPELREIRKALGLAK